VAGKKYEQRTNVVSLNDSVDCRKYRPGRQRCLIRVNQTNHFEFVQLCPIRHPVRAINSASKDRHWTAAVRSDNDCYSIHRSAIVASVPQSLELFCISSSSCRFVVCSFLERATGRGGNRECG
jgi:hypothetical protein